MKRKLSSWGLRGVLVFGALFSRLSPAQQAIVDPSVVYQRIDGFGASSAFVTASWTVNQADQFFSTNTGIGLSLLRTQIQPGGTANANEIALMQLAQARGARVWSTPWSPQASFKDNNNTIGGNFLSASNQAYASQLAGYVSKMATSGVHLYALSIQNEPDANVGYVSCHWTAQQFNDFVPYLYNALAASNVSSTKIMLPESESWANNDLYSTSLNDAGLAGQVGILANHNYDGVDFNHGATSTPLPLNSHGLPVWETEVSTGDPFDGSITNAIYWAGRIHQFMTVAQVNAWHYWWLLGLAADNEGLTDQAGHPAKRMYVMGQFSRFVRPNFYRISATTAQSAAQVTAYKDSASPGFAIVAINPTDTAINHSFAFTNLVVASAVPYITSATLSLTRQAAISLTNSSFTFNLPALSVVTFVGQAQPSNAAPVFMAAADQLVNPGATLTVTNTATAPVGTTETFVYSLVSGPGNATLNASSGLFTWRPTVAQAGTTNTVSVKATVSGNNSLSATNHFEVIVNPVVQPVLSLAPISSKTFQIEVSGAAGPDYTLMTSTNLIDWEPVTTSNSPVLPFTFLELPLTDTVRAYRVELGP